MPLTAALASAQLAEVTTVAQLRALIAQVDIAATGTVTVFYSGAMPDGGRAIDVARDLASQAASVRIIDNTEAAQFLNLDVNLALRAKLDALVGGDPSLPGTASNRFLYGTYDASGTRVSADGIWDEVSGRFAEATVGEVRVIAHRAGSDRIFAATELPALLRSGGVTSIEGVPVSELKAVEAASGSGEAFKRVRLASEWSLAASGVTSASPLAFLDSTLLDQQTFLESHPDAYGRLDDYYAGRQANALSAADAADRRTTVKAMLRIAEGTELSGQPHPQSTGHAWCDCRPRVCGKRRQYCP